MGYIQANIRTKISFWEPVSWPVTLSSCREGKAVSAYAGRNLPSWVPSHYSGFIVKMISSSKFDLMNTKLVLVHHKHGHTYGYIQTGHARAQVQ